jgi:hypothetical protein
LLPAILSQRLYIDLYSNGIDTAIGQIVNVIQGNTTFNPNNNNFSNLVYEVKQIENNAIEIKISAIFYLEPIASFLILIDNSENELTFALPSEGIFYGGFNNGVKLNNGLVVNAQLMRAQRGITPTVPLRISIKSREDAEIKFKGVLHQKSETDYMPVPRRY